MTVRITYKPIGALPLAQRALVESEACAAVRRAVNRWLYTQGR